jgi:predicted transcriptional regulator
MDVIVMQEKDEMASANPDLHFNSATVHQYLEDYERALQRFEAASIRDPGLHAQHEVSKLVNLLSRLEDLTVNKVGWLTSCPSPE